MPKPKKQAESEANNTESDIKNDVKKEEKPVKKKRIARIYYSSNHRATGWVPRINQFLNDRGDLGNKLGGRTVVFSDTVRMSIEDMKKSGSIEHDKYYNSRDVNYWFFPFDLENPSLPKGRTLDYDEKKAVQAFFILDKFKPQLMADGRPAKATPQGSDKELFMTKEAGIFYDEFEVESEDEIPPVFHLKKQIKPHFLDEYEEVYKTSVTKIGVIQPPSRSASVINTEKTVVQG